MAFLERIKDDLKSAQKAGDAFRVSVIRLLLAALHNREIEKRGQGQDPTLTDEDAMRVLQGEAKRRKEAIELFRKGGRHDLGEKEEQELALINDYLPAPLGREEVARVVASLIAAGHKDFSVLMREAMKQLKGKVGGEVVSEVVKEKLK